MAVCVDEAGEQRTSAQRDLARARAGEGTNVCVAADGKDTPTANGDCLDDVVPHIDGVDLAPCEDNLRRAMPFVVSRALMGRPPVADGVAAVRAVSVGHRSWKPACTEDSCAGVCHRVLRIY